MTTFFPSTIKTLTLPESNEHFKIIGGCLVSVDDMRLVASVAGATAIPDGVVIIGENSFRNKPLDTVVIPDTVTTIRANAFQGCSFTAVELPDSVGVLDSSAFDGCSEMLSITFGARINLENNGLFGSMKKLKTLSVSLDNPYMYSLTDVLYSKSTNTIVHFAPKHSGDITLADGLETLPAEFFRYAQADVFTIPDSVSSVEKGALTNMTIGTLRLGKNAPLFDEETYGSVTMTDGAEVSADNPYMTADGGVLYNKGITKLLLFPLEKASYVFPDTVTEVASGVYMPYLADVTIGAGISRESFETLVYDSGNRWTSPLPYPETVRVSENNAELTEFYGVVYTKDKQHLVYIPANFDGDLILPKEMTVFDDILVTRTYYERFVEDGGDGYTQPASLHIRTLRAEEGSKLTSVSSVAFVGGDNISSGSEDISDRLPAWYDLNLWSYRSVTLQIDKIDLTNATQFGSIGENAFARQESLTEAVFPNSLAYIDFGAFQMCSALEKVTGIANAEMGGSVFYGCNKLYDGNGWMILGGTLLAFDTKSSSASSDIVIPDTVKKVAGGAFNFVSARSIRIPATVELVCASAIRPSSNSSMVIYIDSEATELEDGWLSESYNAEVIVIACGVSDSGVYFYLDPETGLYYRLDQNDNTARLLDDNTATDAWAGKVALAGSIEYGGATYALTEIADYAFSEASSGDITEITLPNTLRKIGAGIFKYMQIEELALPDGVTEIGAYLFDGNEMIRTVTLSAKITQIPNNAFYDCVNLERVTGGAVTAIGNRAFYQCAKLASLDARLVKSIGTYAFGSCTALQTFDLAAVETVGDYAFRNSGLTAAVFSAAKTIGSYAFNGCTALAEIVLNEGIESVGTQAFCSTAITELTVPASLTNVGDYAFYGNPSLAKVIFSGGIAGKGAFQQNIKLAEVIFTGGAPYSVGESAFYKCGALTSVSFGDGLTAIGGYAFSQTGVGSVVFPETLETIGGRAFYQAELTSVSFPASLKSMGEYAFASNYKTVLSKDGETTEKVYTLAQITFSEGLESIGEYAFYLASVESLDMPASLTQYGDYAFYGCNSLKSVTFADGSTKVGGKGAFQQCAALESVTFGSSEGLTIAVQMFYNAKNLKEVIFDENCVVKEIGNYAFGGTALTELTLPEVEIMGVSVFYHCVQLTVTVPYAEGALPDGWSAKWNTSADAKVVYAK